MIVATWNVNSVRMREERLLRWLSTRQPDVVCLQELKCVDEEFPRSAIESLGYKCEVWGQRSYNGVAILARAPLEEVQRGFGRPGLDDEARLLSATVDGVRVVCAYVPAGGENLQSPKYHAKISWLGALLDLVRERRSAPTPLVLCGDFNIAPEADDVASREKWRDSPVFNEELSGIFRALLSEGMTDCFRLETKETGRYTWWDYDDLGYQRNDGLRIDHILAPTALEDRCCRCWIDWEEREGPKPSDHAPVLADFDWALRRGGRRGGGGVGAARGAAKFVGRAAPVYGGDAARSLVREALGDLAPPIPEGARIRVRWPGGFEEELLWNYFPAGAREWTFDGADDWFEIATGRREGG